MPRLRVLPFAALALALGCSATPSETEDTLDRVDGVVTATVLVSEASAGTTIEVRFANAGDVRYWISTCGRRVERRVDGEWEALPPELLLCRAIVYSIPANGETVRVVDVPLDAIEGTHRFEFTVTPDVPAATNEMLRSTTFVVR
jgi:hypothetical protein